MFFKYNYPGIVWAIIILILLGLPGNDFPDTFFLNIPHLDKAIHLFLFFVFAFLLVRGFTLQNRIMLLKKHFLLFSLSIGISYGGLTEILQYAIFTGRTSDVLDFIFDIIGCCVGILLFVFYQSIKTQF